MLVSTYGELFCSPLNVVLSTIPSEVDKMEARLDTAENRPPRTYDQSDSGPFWCRKRPFSYDSHGWRGRKPGRNRKSRVTAESTGYYNVVAQMVQDAVLFDDPGTEPCDCLLCNNWPGYAEDLDLLAPCTRWHEDDWREEQESHEDAEWAAWKLQNRWEKYCSFLIKKTWGSWNFYEGRSWESHEVS